MGLRQVAQRNDHRRLADDPVPPVDELGELRQRLQAVARVRLPCGLLARSSGRPSPAFLSAPFAELDRSVDGADAGPARTAARTRCPSCASRRTRPSTRDTPAPTRSVAARPSALLKPLLRAAIVKLAAMRFTSYSKGPGSVSSKSFRSNTQLPLRRCEHTEVREVRVAAQLHVEPSGRRVLQVRGHDLRRAPVERERRDHHAPVAHRHEIGLTRGVLLLEQRHRVRAIRRRLPPRVTRRRYSLTRRLPTRLCAPRHSDARSSSPATSFDGPTARPVPTAVDRVDPANTLPRPSGRRITPSKCASPPTIRIVAPAASMTSTPWEKNSRLVMAQRCTNMSVGGNDDAIAAEHGNHGEPGVRFSQGRAG